jgi:hypothetical protein
MRKPAASKTYVLTSPSLPWAGISLPFSSKLMPAAFPVLTTTCPLARTEVCAGAIRVSWATGLPSAVIETQLVSSARISTLKVLVGAAGAVEAVTSSAVGLAGDEFAGGVVAVLAAESVDVAEGGLADGVIPASGVFAFSGVAARGGWLGCDGGRLIGAATGA